MVANEIAYKAYSYFMCNYLQCHSKLKRKSRESLWVFMIIYAYVYVNYHKQKDKNIKHKKHRKNISKKTIAA